MGCCSEWGILWELQVLVPQLCLTLCDPMNCSLLASSVHGILQARILEWVASSFSRGSSWLRDQTQVSHIAGRFVTIWATGKPYYLQSVEFLEPNNAFYLLFASNSSRMHFSVSFCSNACFSFCMPACLLSCFTRVQLFAALWTVAHQAPLSLGFSSQEHSNGVFH